MSERDWTWGTKITAVFKPVELDTLKPEFKKLIGKRLTLTYDFIREVGQYKGQHSFMYDQDGIYGWIPLEDLQDIKELKGE